MDLPTPPPFECRFQRGVTSEASRERMKSFIPVVVYDGQIGNRRDEGVRFYTSLGRTSSTFELQLRYRDTPLTFDLLVSEIHEKHSLPDLWVITNVIYRCPTRGPNGNIKYRMYEIKNNDDVGSMISTCRRFREEVRQIELCIRVRVIVDPVCTQLTPFSVEKRLTAIYYNGIITTTRTGVKFDCADIKLCRMKKFCTYEELKNKIIRKCRDTTHGLAAIYFRCPVDVGGLGHIHWIQMRVETDTDVEQLFTINNEHRTLGPIELYADFRRTIDEVIALLSPPSVSNLGDP